METRKNENIEERAPEGTDRIEYGTPSKHQSLWVAVWLAIPLLGCLVYGYLTR